jgi:hypothetical protein
MGWPMRTTGASSRQKVATVTEDLNFIDCCQLTVGDGEMIAERTTSAKERRSLSGDLMEGGTLPCLTRRRPDTQKHTAEIPGQDFLP